MSKCMIIRRGGGAVTGMPKFTYTGSYSLIDDGDKNWRLKLLSSGTLTFEKDYTVDLFMVGSAGGGSGAKAGVYEGSGGAGGYTRTVSSIVAQAGVGYPIVIGAAGTGGAAETNGTNGAATTGFTYSANGGEGGQAAGKRGGNGGSGAGSGGAANGGSNGSNGSAAVGHTAGIGQGTTTREFGEAATDLYAGGGSSALGGDGGGGGYVLGVQQAGTNGLGGGGAGGLAGGDKTGRNGGTGIFILRNHR